jgi:hypothetical protein
MKTVIVALALTAVLCVVAHGGDSQEIAAGSPSGLAGMIAYWKCDRVKYLSEPERHKDHCELRSGTIEEVQAENKKNSRYLSKRDVCDSQVVKNDPEGEEDCDLFGPRGKMKRSKVKRPSRR